MTTPAVPSTDAASPPRVRARRRRRRWVVVLGAIGMIVVASWLLVVPRVVESVLRGRMAAYGFDDVQIGAIAVGLDRVVLRDLRIGMPGTGDVLVPTLTAEFSPTDLWHRRLDVVELDAPVWTMANAPERAGSPFTQFQLREADPDEPPRALPRSAVRRLVVRNARFVPARVGAGPAGELDATFTSAATRWQLELQGIVAGRTVKATAAVDVADALADATLGLAVAGAQPLDLTGTARITIVDGARVIDAEVRRAPGAFDWALADGAWTGAGGVTARAHVPMADLAAATIDVEVDDLAVTSAQGLQLEGLDVATRLFGLPAPVTRAPQRVTWRRLQVADFAAGAGEAEWQLGPGYEVTATARQRLADGVGSLELTGLRAAPGVARFPAKIAFEQVSLQELLELLSKGKVTGEGRISGDVAVVVHTKPRLAIDIQGGRLAAAPGGLVRFLDDKETEEMIREHAKQIAASTGHDTLVQERIVGALKEFAYSTLDFRLQPEPDGKGVTLNVHAAGKGRKVPQELDLTVNLHGFDTALDTALAIKFGLDRARRQLGDKLGASSDDQAADSPARKPAGKESGKDDDESPDRPNGQRKP